MMLGEDYMKKKLFILIGIFVFLIPFTVDAKEALGTCNYDLDVNELFMQNVISELISFDEIKLK